MFVSQKRKKILLNLRRKKESLEFLLHRLMKKNHFLGKEINIYLEKFIQTTFFDRVDRDSTIKNGIILTILMDDK